MRPRALSLLTILLAALVLAIAPAPLAAQEEQQLSREERLRQHEARVREIIDQRRREQLERSQQQPEAAPEPVEEAPPPDEAPVRLGRVILTSYFHKPDGEGREFDTVVRVGDRFVSDVVLQNEGATSFDRVRVALKYDKRFVRPLRLFDNEIRPYLAGDPEFRRIDRDSVLVYDARLDQPRVTRELPILRIVWEAVRPIEHTALNFVFSGTDEDDVPDTAVFQSGRNILGDPNDPFDGVLGSSILVLRPQGNLTERPEVLQGKKEELRSIYLGSIGVDSPAGIMLAGPDSPIGVGDEFTVDVMLNNPNGATIDSVSVFLKFDPKVLQVIDQDGGNWVRRGINVHDGPFRLQYPFDYHKRNEADNVRGLIHYSKGTGSALALPTGTFARVHFQAIAPTDATRVELISGRQGAVNLTALTTFGFNLFSTDPELTTPLFETVVLPEPVGSDQLAGRIGQQAGEVPAFLHLIDLFPTQKGVAELLSHR